jgi:competence ComEA-like helix-hairpin-helix protein
MPTAERRALLLLLALAVAGQGVRYLLTKPGDAPGGVQLLSALGSESPLAQRDSAERKARPLREGERIDVDQASAGELARLPKVGPRLAKVIVAERQEHGAFGGIEGLDRVPGIGPGLLKTLTPHVSFSRERGGVRSSGPLPESPAAPLNVNTASLSQLDALPGIGPAKAKAIIRYREEHGQFTATEGLAAVPGMTRALLLRLQERVVVR